MATGNGRRSKRSSTPRKARSKNSRSRKAGQDRPTIQKQYALGFAVSPEMARDDETFFTTEDEARRSEIRYLIREELGKALREEQHLTQSQVANMVGVNPAAVGSGRIPSPQPGAQSKAPRLYESGSQVSELYDKLCDTRAQMTVVNSEINDHAAGSLQLHDLVIRLDSLRRDYTNILEMYRGIVMHDALIT